MAIELHGNDGDFSKNVRVLIKTKTEKGDGIKQIIILF